MNASDPFPTIRLSVPHLRELLERLRSDTIRHGTTIVHAKRPEEGEWTLSNARARLMRGTLKIVGHEAARASRPGRTSGPNRRAGGPDGRNAP